MNSENFTAILLFYRSQCHTVSSQRIDNLIEMSTELPPILFDIELDYTK